MKQIDVYPIGTEVWYFDPVLEGDCEIKSSIVLGSFVHKSEGSLFYFLLDKQVEGYAVSNTEDGAIEQRNKFLEYRERLLQASAENKVRFNELRKGTVFPEYSIENLSKTGEEDE